MAFLFGNQASASKPNVPDAGLRVQSSVLGKVRTFGVGRTRIAANIIWQGDFKATPVQQQTSGSKGFGGDGCFPAGTLIDMWEGSPTPIESITVGDVVRSFDDAGEFGPSTVEEVFVHEHHKVVEFTFFNRGPLRTTTNHWFLLSDGTYASLEEGFHGEDLIADDGTRLNMIGHRMLPEETVYTFRCEPANTFIAGGVRVHNLGGGGKSGTGSFTYSVAVILGLADGPIADLGIEAVYLNVPTSDGSSTVPGAVDPDSLNFTRFYGTYTQDAWAYTATLHPDQTLAYRGLAYVAAGPFALGNNNTLPNMTFEVVFHEHGSLPGLPDGDSNAAEWIRDLLLNEFHGAGFPSANIGPLNDYRDYSIATGMCVSDAMVSSTALNSYLGDLVKATNSEFVFSSGVLNVVPYGDENVAGNGSAYTAPVLAGSVAILTDDDYIYDNSAKGPVSARRSKPQDANNIVTVEYLDRNNLYNPTPIEAKDEAAIIQYGIRRADPAVYHFFALGSAAQQSAYLLLSRQAVRNTFTFTVGPEFIFLDPMDYIQINDVVLGLVDQMVLIKEINETAEGNLDFICEEFVNNSHTPLYMLPTYVQPPTLGDPGWTNALLIDSTSDLDPAGPSITVAANGLGAGFNAQRGWVTFWYNPIGKRNGDTAPNANPDDVYTMIMANSNGAGDGRALAIFENASSAPDFSITLVIDIYSSHQGTLLPRYVFMCRTVPVPVGAGGFAIGIEWDGHDPTWSARMYINGVDATDDAWMAANSGFYTTLGFTPGLFMQAVLDGSYPVPYGRNTTYTLLGWSDGYLTGEAELSQPWLLLSPPTRATLDTMWSMFFDANNSPIDLGSGFTAGTLPFAGVRPVLYYPHNESVSVGVSEGILSNTLAGPAPVVTGAYADAVTIPAAITGYQAVGLHVTTGVNVITNEPLIVINAETNAGTASSRIWGGAFMWVSQNGTDYARIGTISGPTVMGYLTSSIPSTPENPITTFTFDIDTSAGQSLQALPFLGFAGADAGTFPMAIADMGAQEYEGAAGGTEPPVPIPYEMFAYSNPGGSFDGTTNLGYIRPGIKGTQALAWDATDNSAMGIKVAPVSGPFVAKFPYSPSIIGTVIFYKLQPFNPQGTGIQDISTVPIQRLYIQGPGQPTPPSAFSVINTSSNGIEADWIASVGATVTYDLAWQNYNTTYNIADSKVGTATFYLNPVNTPNVQTGFIFSARFDAGQIDGADAGIIAGSEIFVLFNAASVGTYTLLHRITTVQANVTYILWTQSTPQTIGTPVAVGIEWDGSGSTWTASIFIDGVDATDYAFQAAASSAGGVPGTTMGTPMDGQYVFNDTYGCWFMGDDGWEVDANGFPMLNQTTIPPHNQQYGISQLYIGAGLSLDLSDPLIWASFFNGSNLPIALGMLGQLPTTGLNVAPYIYFPTDPTNVGNNVGQGTTLSDGKFIQGGGINTGYFPNGAVAKGTMIGNQSYIGAAAGSAPGYAFLTRGIPQSTTTYTATLPMVGANQLFQLRTVNAAGVPSTTWLTDTITTGAGGGNPNGPGPHLLADFFDDFSGGFATNWIQGFPWETGTTVVKPTYVQSDTADTPSMNPFSTGASGLTIRAALTNGDPGASGKLYFTGLLSSNFTQLFGYFEYKASMPSSPGAINGALWLYHLTGGGVQETDVLEHQGTYAMQTVWDGSIANPTHAQFINTITSPHVYGVEWNTTNITFWIDGNQTFQTPTPTNHQSVAMAIVLSMNIGSPNLDGTTLPQTMNVEYVGVWPSKAVRDSDV